MKTRKDEIREELSKLSTVPWWRRMGWTDYSSRVRALLLEGAFIEMEEKRNGTQIH